MNSDKIWIGMRVRTTNLRPANDLVPSMFLEFREEGEIGIVNGYEPRNKHEASFWYVGHHDNRAIAAYRGDELMPACRK